MKILHLQLVQTAALPLADDEAVDMIPQRLVSGRQEGPQLPVGEWFVQQRGGKPLVP